MDALTKIYPAWYDRVMEPWADGDEKHLEAGYDVPIRIPVCDACDPHQVTTCKGFEGVHFCGEIRGHGGKHVCSNDEYTW